MSILVFVQQEQGKPLKAGLSAVSAALELAKLGGDKVVAVLLGDGAASAGAELAQRKSLSQVLHCEAAELSTYRAVPYAQALLAAAQQSSANTVVMAATSSGKDAGARLAAMFDAAQASDITAVNSDGSLRRPMYAGNVFADVELVGERKVITVRPTAFQPAAADGGSVPSAALSVSFDMTLAGEVTGFSGSKSERPELSDAEIVVSGGRALQSAENFEKYIFPLADAFGAAVGASRAAVDSGYAPNDWQVGQTGKVVAPSLYVAVGISGAIQHLAGMKDSKKIVAINKDPEAPIFEVADYGLVADLYQAVPELTEAVKKARGK